MRYLAAVAMIAIAVGCLVSARRMGKAPGRSPGLTLLSVVVLAGLAGALVVSALRLIS